MSETTAKRGRKPANKVSYRHDENSPKLVAWPVDYDPAKNTPLTPDDFADEVQYIYWDQRASVYKARMEEAIQEADLCRKYGSKDQRDKVSQLVKLKAKLDALKAELGDIAL